MTIEGGRLFYFRCIDWAITTPLLLLDLALLALADPRRNAGFIAGLIGLEVFMILTGFLAGFRSSGFGRGFWFLVSTAAMIALLYLIVTRLFSEAAGQPEAVNRIFRGLAYLTVVLWALYPIVWLIGTEGLAGKSRIKNSRTSTVEFTAQRSASGSCC
jgi:bacteriorhodopsin